MIWALHGNLGSPADWEAVQNQMRGSLFERVNLWSDTVLPFSSWVTRFNSLADALDPHPVLLGYSLGARLAMHAVLAPNASWKAAIFVSGHPGLQHEADCTRRLFKDIAWADRLRSGDIDRFLEDWNAQMVLSTSPVSEQQKDIARVYSERIADAFEAWSLGRQRDLRPALAACEIPQLWVVGGKDESFRTLASDAVEAIPSARLHVIPDSGHRVPLQHPKELADCMRDFLSDLNLTDV